MKWSRRIYWLVPLAAAVASWELLARSLASPELPPASAVMSSIVADWQLLLASAAMTLSRAVLGLLLATALGIVLGFLISISQGAYRSLMPLIDVLRPIPSTALVFLFFAWFGFDRTPVLLTTYGCLWPIVIATRDRMEVLKRETHETLDLLALGVTDRVRYVYSRALLPGVLSGIRVALSVAMILTVTAELLATPSGLAWLESAVVVRNDAHIAWALGAYLQFYREQDITRAMGAVLVAGVCGLLLGSLYRRLLYLPLLRHSRLLELQE